MVERDTVKDFNEGENEFEDALNDFSNKENEDTAKKDEEEMQRAELPFTYALQFPYKMGNKDITEVVFKHRMRVEFIKHLPVQVKDQKLGHFTKPIAGMTGLPTAFIDAMDKVDFDECLMIVQPFL